MQDDTPISRLGRAYEAFRENRAARREYAWIAVGIIAIVSLNLWIALTDSGRDVWAWFVG